MADKPNKSTLQVVIENKYLVKLVDGSIWEFPEAEIKAIEETLVRFRIIIAAAFRMHDEELTTRRSIHGNDHLKSLEFFRKPRDSKSGNKLIDELKI